MHPLQYQFPFFSRNRLLNFTFTTICIDVAQLGFTNWTDKVKRAKIGWYISRFHPESNPCSVRDVFICNKKEEWEKSNDWIGPFPSQEIAVMCILFSL